LAETTLEPEIEKRNWKLETRNWKIVNYFPLPIGKLEDRKQCGFSCITPFGHCEGVRGRVIQTGEISGGIMVREDSEAGNLLQDLGEFRISSFQFPLSSF
jgi:hypothetical protein